MFDYDNEDRDFMNEEVIEVVEAKVIEPEPQPEMVQPEMVQPEMVQPEMNQGKKKSKKKSKLVAKATGIVAAGVLFGVVAGVTMFGVNTAGEFLKEKYIPQVETTQTKTTLAVAPTTEAAEGASEAASVSTTMSVADIAENVMPSVVSIVNTMEYQQQTWFGPSQTIEIPSSGSGIIIGQNEEELLVATNNHVVDGATQITVAFIDGEEVTAAIKGTDADADLAVIAIPVESIPTETMETIKIATIGDSDALKIGEGVVAIGNALGYGQSVTVGYVSAKDREITTDTQVMTDLIQTDAAINPGNSGGALLNMNGEVIGINTAKTSSTQVEGIGYAIPISKAQDIINELMNRKTRVEVEVAKQGYLGIQGQNIDDTAQQMYGMPKGVYVYKILEDSAAAGSDLREKDIITKFDGQSISSMTDLQKMLTYYESGTTVTVTVQSLTEGEYVERQIEITLGSRPQETEES